mmetsp:Transcript_5926/g.9059  ORF Transcript_5926/g.9059 Transcript_5926/m.9059 type:complete len:84 (-) Transcript_5926:62-313(-)|eukprot:CAMPEP_0118688822 /NCGR_PEP_ID=MMETSP0800-20121206/9133_1 /TAXON_ID=210618 ORGANISM="Striatella unipunctata, Strain CCMP2910" /NCGR_SAMPLE_ID=MMETSP0800 /ASSEMBLY_ACC=CAM_ASM_000638 /LENGTH=83 /DNA_ID=CAMNT_0006586123 /DNA_START=61 /DNA_END=312 /DNA_ORIENTATION=+
MGLSLWNLFKAGLLMTNSIMILNRKRFLVKYGLDDVNNINGSAGDNPMKVQIIGLLQAVTYLKLPVIAANAVVILVEMLLGGT